MVVFSDSQLRAVWAAADRVPVEKRGAISMTRCVQH
jgi:hypothetical protein